MDIVNFFLYLGGGFQELIENLHHSLNLYISWHNGLDCEKIDRETGLSILKEKSNFYWFYSSKLSTLYEIFCGNY